MRKLVLAALAATMLCGSAQAAVMNLNFSGGGFAGSFSYDDASASLLSINFNQAGKVYDLNSAGLFDFGSDLILGGTINQVIGIQTLPAVTSTSDNDFRLQFNRTSFVVDEFVTQTANVGYADNTVGARVMNASVPEPASWAMMIVGFGVLGATMRRRKVAVGAVSLMRTRLHWMQFDL